MAHSSMLCSSRSFIGSKKNSTSSAAVEMLLNAPLIRTAARFCSFASSLTKVSSLKLVSRAQQGSTRHKRLRGLAAQ